MLSQAEAEKLKGRKRARAPTMPHCQQAEQVPSWAPQACFISLQPPLLNTKSSNSPPCHSMLRCWPSLLGPRMHTSVLTLAAFPADPLPDSLPNPPSDVPASEKSSRTLRQAAGLPQAHIAKAACSWPLAPQHAVLGMSYFHPPEPFLARESKLAAMIN